MKGELKPGKYLFKYERYKVDGVPSYDIGAIEILQVTQTCYRWRFATTDGDSGWNCGEYYLKEDFYDKFELVEKLGGCCE